MISGREEITARMCPGLSCPWSIAIRVMDSGKAYPFSSVFLAFRIRWRGTPCRSQRSGAQRESEASFLSSSLLE